MKDKSDGWKHGNAEEFLYDITSRRMRVFDWTYNNKYMLLHPWYYIRDIYYSLKWAWQRVYRGWDDRVPWGIDFYLCSIMPAAINILIKHREGTPPGFTADEWVKTLIKIRDGFIAGYDIMVVNYDYEIDGERKKLFDKAYEGLELFSKHFFNLWW